MHFNYGSGLTGILTRLLNIRTKDINFEPISDLKFHKYDDLIDHFTNSKNDNVFKYINRENIESIKRDLADSNPSKLLTDVDEQARFKDLVESYAYKEGVSEKLTDLTFNDIFEEHLMDKYKEPQFDTLYRSIRELENRHRISINDLSTKDIKINHDYMYDESLSPMQNGLFKIIDTFDIPKDVIDVVKENLLLAKDNPNIQSKLIEELLKTSNIFTESERNGDVLPTISALAITEKLNDMINFGKSIIENEKLIKNHQLSPNDFKINSAKKLTYDTFSLNKVSEYIQKIHPEMDKGQIINEIQTTIDAIPNKVSPTNIMDVFKNRYKDSIDLTKDYESRNTKNKMFDELDKAQRQFKEVELLESTAGIIPDDNMYQKLTKIITNISSRYDSNLLKNNSIYRDIQTDALNEIYDMLGAINNATSEEITSAMDGMLVDLYDGKIPTLDNIEFGNKSNFKPHIIANLKKINELNLDLSHLINSEYRKITGHTVNFRPEFYYKQQWSPGKIRESVAKMSGISETGKVTYHEGSKALESLHKLGDEFYSLLDIEKMGFFHDNDINQTGKVYSEKRKVLSDKLKNMGLQTKDTYITNEVSKIMDNIFKSVKGLKNPDREVMRKIRKIVGQELGINDLTSPKLREINSTIREVGYNDSIKTIRSALVEMMNDVNKPITKEEFMESFLDLSIGNAKEKMDYETPKSIILGNRAFYFKDGSAFRKAISLFSDDETILNALKRSTDYQIKKLTVLKEGFVQGLDVRKLVDSFYDVHGLKNKETLENLNIVSKQLKGTLTAILDTMFNSQPYLEQYPKSKLGQMLEAGVSLSALGGLFQTILASDSIGMALATNKGFKNVVYGFGKYFQAIFSKIPNSVKKVVVASTDHMFLREDRVRETVLEKSYKLMDKIWGITDVDSRGKYALTYGILKGLTEEIKTGNYNKGFISKLLREKGMTTKHFEFLKREFDNLVYEDNEGQVLSLRGFYDHPILEDIESFIYRMVQSTIPSRGILSKSLQNRANGTAIPVFNFVLTNFMRFAGISIEHLFNSTIDPIASGGIRGMNSRYTLIALSESLLYHFLSDLGKGKTPYWVDKDGKIDKEKVFTYFRKALLDSPIFGFFGGLADALLSGDTNGFIGMRVTGAYTPIVKSLQAIGDIGHGKYGRAYNDVISGMNSVNPIRNVPYVGLAFDRAIIDPFRAFFYKDIDKYRASIKRYAEQSGLKYYA